MIDRRRRHLPAAVLGLLDASRPAFAQPKDKSVRIGWLGNTEGGTPQARAIRAAFIDELQHRGWVDFSQKGLVEPTGGMHASECPAPRTG